MWLMEEQQRSQISESCSESLTFVLGLKTMQEGSYTHISRVKNNAVIYSKEAEATTSFMVAG